MCRQAKNRLGILLSCVVLGAPFVSGHVTVFDSIPGRGRLSGRVSARRTIRVASCDSMSNTGPRLVAILRGNYSVGKEML